MGATATSEPATGTVGPPGFPSFRGDEPPPRSPGRLPYTPALDGVRALAVGAVLLSQAQVAAVPGGFLGVDVFFVLSGYLITSLLLAEARGAGRIDLFGFWAGRIRRLLPAAILVVAVSLVVVAVFGRGDLPRVPGEALSFGWSLSTEGQFCLAWPVLLAAGLAWLGRRRTMLTLVVAAGVSAGLMALLHHPGADPFRALYETDTRAAPLMLGAILAFAWPLGRMTFPPGRGAAQLLDGIGLAGLLGLLALIHGARDHDPFLDHGGFLVVALAAAAVIATAVHPATRLGRWLGAPTLRWIGQRSYGIYLWHWPVMALSPPGVDVPGGRWVRVAAQIAVTVALAAGSYRYLETPIRRGGAGATLGAWHRGLRSGPTVAAGLAATVVAGSVLVVALLAPPSPSTRLPSTSRASVTRAASAVERPARPVLEAARRAGRRHERHPAASPAPVGSPAGATRPVPATGPVHATFIGDSVPDSIAVTPAARRVLTRGEHVVLDLRVCRRLTSPSCSYQGSTPSTALDAVRARGRRLGPVLIMDVGYNDGAAGYPSSLDATMRAALAQGVRRVVWVTLRETGGYAATYRETNAVIRRASGRWPQLQVADWNAHSAGRPWFAPGDVHLDGRGALALATFLRRFLSDPRAGR